MPLEFGTIKLMNYFPPSETELDHYTDPHCTTIQKFKIHSTHNVEQLVIGHFTENA